jgi:hypothetical protein
MRVIVVGERGGDRAKRGMAPGSGPTSTSVILHYQAENGTLKKRGKVCGVRCRNVLKMTAVCL